MLGHATLFHAVVEIDSGASSALVCKLKMLQMAVVLLIVVGA